VLDGDAADGAAGRDEIDRAPVGEGPGDESSQGGDRGVVGRRGDEPARIREEGRPHGGRLRRRPLGALATEQRQPQGIRLPEAVLRGAARQTRGLDGARELVELRRGAGTEPWRLPFADRVRRVGQRGDEPGRPPFRQQHGEHGGDQGRHAGKTPRARRRPREWRDEDESADQDDTDRDCQEPRPHAGHAVRRSNIRTTRGLSRNRRFAHGHVNS
jgi:hypothetical protein